MSTNPNNMFANRPTNISNPFGKVINITKYRNQIIIIIQILIHLITPIQIITITIIIIIWLTRTIFKIIQTILIKTHK